MDTRLGVGGHHLPIEGHVGATGDGERCCEAVWAEAHPPGVGSGGQGAEGDGGQASDDQAVVGLWQIGSDHLNHQ